MGEKRKRKYWLPVFSPFSMMFPNLSDTNSILRVPLGLSLANVLNIDHLKFTRLVKTYRSYDLSERNYFLEQMRREKKKKVVSIVRSVHLKKEDTVNRHVFFETKSLIFILRENMNDVMDIMNTSHFKHLH